MNHAAAVAVVKRQPGARFLLTELIVAEVATRVRARAGAVQAVTVVHELLRSRRYEVVFVDTELMEGALDRMARCADKRLSLTDCASFALMDRLELRRAFAFDRDFRDCGYATIP